MIGDGLLIAGLFLLPGYAGWIAFSKSLQNKPITDGADTTQGNPTIFEILFLIVLGGLVVVLWLGMLFAELGVFSLPLLMSITVVSSMLVGGWAIINGRSLNPFRGATGHPLTLLVIPILAIAIWLSPQPFEYINGGRDHGLYINTGINIARTGRILIQDDELTAVPEQSRPLLINPEVSVSPKPRPWTLERGAAITRVDYP